ncbi:MAG: hypothetical protein WC549_07555 [Actinomycetota bacterium]
MQKIIVNIIIEDDDIRPIAYEIYCIRSRHGFSDNDQGDWFRAIRYLHDAIHLKCSIWDYLKWWEDYLAEGDKIINVT